MLTPAKVEIYQGPDGWRFRIKARNGEIVATGEAYVRRIDAIAAAQALVPGSTVIVEVDD
jgi:uncharacterized protein YegP (UPF0339 family)